MWWRQYVDAEGSFPYRFKDFALADKKLFSTLRYAAHTTADTHKALTELRNNIFKNISVLEALKQHTGTGDSIYKWIQLPFYFLMKTSF